MGRMFAQGGDGHSGSVQIEKSVSYKKVPGVGKLEHEGGEEGKSVRRASHGAQLCTEYWSPR